MKVDELAEAFAEVQRHPLVPEVMIMADPEGLEPGTYLLFRGKAPERIGESEDFDAIWPVFLGLTHASCSPSESV